MKPNKESLPRRGAEGAERFDFSAMLSAFSAPLRLCEEYPFLSSFKNTAQT